MGWALIVVRPCRSNSRDRDRVYGQANYQLIVHSQPPGLVDVLISIYLSIYLIVREFLYVPIAMAADIFMANENRWL